MKLIERFDAKSKDDEDDDEDDQPSVCFVVGSLRLKQRLLLSVKLSSLFGIFMLFKNIYIVIEIQQNVKIKLVQMLILVNVN